MVVLPGVRGGVRGLHGDHVRVAGPGRARAARGEAAVGAAGRRRGGSEVTCGRKVILLYNKTKCTLAGLYFYYCFTYSP